VRKCCAALSPSGFRGVSPTVARIYSETAGVIDNHPAVAIFQGNNYYGNNNVISLALPRMFRYTSTIARRQLGNMLDDKVVQQFRDYISNLESSIMQCLYLYKKSKLKTDFHNQIF